VQGTTFGTGTKVLSTTVTLAGAVSQGDLLVGWFSQYDAAAEVQVSDNVNGAWTRAARSLAFQNDLGDLALYYRENSRAAGPAGLTVTVSVPQAAFLQGTLAEYSGVAVAGSLDQVASARNIGTVVDTGSTAPVGAGELAYSAIITGGLPGTVTPGTSQGQTYVARTPATGSSYEQDVTAGAAGAQDGTATLATSTDWYAVVAVFHPVPTGATQAPTTPGGLTVTSAASSRVALAWSPSSGTVAGYTVYRNGAAVGTLGPAQTSFLDSGVAAASSYTYAVDAFNLAGQHSAQSSGAGVTTPSSAPTFVQGGAMSPGTRLPSVTLSLSKPVSQGDLLVGWFGQFNTAGQVQVSDNVNGPWTRSISEGFSSGSGDIALFFVRSAAAPSGLTVTVTDPAGAAYLQFALADFRDPTQSWTLDQAVVSEATTGAPSVGPTGSVHAGDLVVASVLTGGQPGWTAAGSDSQRVPYQIDAHNGSTSSDLEDILSSAAGPQQAGFTLGSGSDWYMVIATFKLSSPPSPPSGSPSGSRPVPVNGYSSVLVNGDGHLEAFYRQADGTVVHSWQPSWGTWYTLASGPDMQTAPVAGLNADGRAEAFAVGSDGVLYHTWQTNWQPWSSLAALPSGVTFAGQPALTRNPDGRLEVFARGSDGGYWHAWQLAANGNWSGWSSLGGSFASDPSVIQNAGDGHLEVFGTSTSGQVMHSFQGAGWSPWYSLGANTFTSRAQVVRNSAGPLELFAVASNGQLYHQWQTPGHGSGWSGWYQAGTAPAGGWQGNPSVTVNPDGHLEVFARSSDGAVWHSSQPAWTPWASLGGSFQGDPVVLNEALYPDLDLWAVGADGQAQEQWRGPDNVWSGWQSRGGPLVVP
jgi:hypothetical protein